MLPSRWSPFLALIAALVVAPAALAAAPPPIAIDPLPLRALLAERDFEALEAQFAAARAAHDSHELTAWLWSLESAAKVQTDDIDAWARKRPESMAARLALAQRELGRAWAARGGGYGNTVTEEGHRAMRTHFERAVSLAAEVADHDPRWLDARRIQIECSRLLGGADLARRAFDAALTIDPTHYGVWSRYQSLFRRRRGGSCHAQQEIAQAAQAHADANPRLRRLLGSADRDRSLDL